MSTLTTTDLLCFDLETTGIDVYGDRIVQAFLGLMDSSGNFYPGKTREWIINPGVPVPAEAAAVHGFSTERLQAEGLTDVAGALFQIGSFIDQLCVAGDIPLVIYNAPFDTTFLNAELLRHGIAPIDFALVDVVDPLVIDKGIDKYRKGSRKLVDTAARYGVPVDLTKAHDAGYDCLLTGRVATLLLQRLSHYSRERLRAAQIDWKAEQSASLQAYFRSPKAKDKQDPAAIVNGEWPVQSRPAAA